jgi:hypothetical protein
MVGYRLVTKRPKDSFQFISRIVICLKLFIEEYLTEICRSS